MESSRLMEGKIESEPVQKSRKQSGVRSAVLALGLVCLSYLGTGCATTPGYPQYSNNEDPVARAIDDATMSSAIYNSGRIILETMPPGTRSLPSW